MKTSVCLFRVPYRPATHGYIYALVTDDRTSALQRLRNDDPIWNELSVELLWEHRISENCRVKIRDRRMLFASRGRQVIKDVRQRRAAA